MWTWSPILLRRSRTFFGWFAVEHRLSPVFLSRKKGVGGGETMFVALEEVVEFFFLEGIFWWDVFSGDLGVFFVKTINQKKKSMKRGRAIWKKSSSKRPNGNFRDPYLFFVSRVFEHKKDAMRFCGGIFLEMWTSPHFNDMKHLQGWFRWCSFSIGWLKRWTIIPSVHFQGCKLKTFSTRMNNNISGHYFLTSTVQVIIFEGEVRGTCGKPFIEKSCFFLGSEEGVHHRFKNILLQENVLYQYRFMYVYILYFWW